ncbi:hypothetical protein DTO271G3_1003 [Paecilomyces variotii]|nr:hypothetical protein DTO271G3_1003 [Paecilomyces variotii]
MIRKEDNPNLSSDIIRRVCGEGARRWAKRKTTRNASWPRRPNDGTIRVASSLAAKRRRGQPPMPLSRTSRTLSQPVSSVTMIKLDSEDKLGGRDSARWNPVRPQPYRAVTVLW